MKISRAWLLKKYLDKQSLEDDLGNGSDAERLADDFTFHAFEVEGYTDDLLDVKVLPNRAADCLSHRGLAKELSAIRGIPLKRDPLREPVPSFPRANALTVEIEDPTKCPRYISAVVKGVTVGPSPSWLREALEAVGQRSINNVVDATNYVMLDIGQPLHAFDAAKLAGKEGRYAIGVRGATKGEKFTTLSGEEYALPEGALLITDAQRNLPIGIAGIKGGKAAEVTEATTDLVIESANFDGPSIRRTAQALALFTEASTRFQNKPSPGLAAYGMRDVLALITDITGGEVIGVVDEYPAPAPAYPPVRVSLARINGLLGRRLEGMAPVTDVFSRRFGFYCVAAGETIIVTPPFERTDLAIPEDLVEEVGRILGYDSIPSVELPPMGEPDQARFRGIERMKDQLIEQGFTEVSTQSFAPKGDVMLANPLDKTKSMLRTSLEDGLADALTKAREYAPLVLPPNAKPKLFEVGSVFPKEGEYLELRMTETAWKGVPAHDNLSKAKLEDYGKDYEPKRYKLGMYKPFSQYPFIVRDVACWVPADTDEASVGELIRKHAGDLAVRLDRFDTFEKEGRTSYAFRLVFQSFERTLTDDEVNAIMEKVYAALKEKGYEIR
ncbi:MAG TPA: phenylalanine--tRNA ligase subunit beta [Candidatus Paceibacterota bacterium]|nr:phenylalanine--tRNA ligase subunit beta [Candidatus Paceibacterota bacterium]